MPKPLKSLHKALAQKQRNARNEALRDAQPLFLQHFARKNQGITRQWKLRRILFEIQKYSLKK